MFRNCNSRFTRQDNSLAHYREKHVEVARQRIEDLLVAREAAAAARAAIAGREVSIAPLTHAPSAREAPALAQAAEDFRRGFINLNGKKAVAVLDEDLLISRGVEHVVRTIGQPYKRAPPIHINGLPNPDVDEETIDPELAAQVAEDEVAREDAEAATEVATATAGTTDQQPSSPSLGLTAGAPAASTMGGTSTLPLATNNEVPVFPIYHSSSTWSSSHPIPPIPPRRR